MQEFQLQRNESVFCRLRLPVAGFGEWGSPHRWSLSSARSWLLPQDARRRLPKPLPWVNPALQSCGAHCVFMFQSQESCPQTCCACKDRPGPRRPGLRLTVCPSVLSPPSGIGSGSRHTVSRQESERTQCASPRRVPGLVPRTPNSHEGAAEPAPGASAGPTGRKKIGFRDAGPQKGGLD